MNTADRNNNPSSHCKVWSGEGEIKSFHKIEIDGRFYMLVSEDLYNNIVNSLILENK